MLNLYLAPRSGKAPRPSDDGLRAALELLLRGGIIGPSTEPDEHPPGQGAAALFQPVSDDDLLPAELTFEALYVHAEDRPAFIPERRLAAGFPDAACLLCGDDLDPEALGGALDRLAYFPVSRFEYVCPSCRTELSLQQVDFGQPTAVARFWFLIEGAAQSRLRSGLVDRLGKALGMPLVVVPEVPEELADDWVPARRRRRRR